MSDFKPQAGRFVTDGHYLYCPRDKINTRALRFGLAYGDHPSEAVVMESHVRVPRSFVIDHMPDITPVRTGNANLTYTKWSSDTSLRTDPREYQVEPLQVMTQVRGGILTLGCGYGKTVLACYYMAHERLKAAVLVDKVNLISQWAEEITKHLNVPAHRVGVVQGKKWEWEDHDIVLISIRTLSTRGDDIPGGFYESFGVAIFDECHHLAAPTFKRVVPRFPGIRIGLSATPKREDGLDIIFRNHLGDVFYEKTDQELIPRIIFHDTGLENSVAEQPAALDRTGEIHYRRLCECLGREELRTELGIEYVKKLRSAGHHILCLSASVQNVLDFAARTSEALGETVGIACGDTKGDQRAKEITNNRVAVGTLDIASEALNVPSLSALLILSPFGAPKYGNTLKQTLGRIQRVTNKKPDPVCIILSDDGIGMCRGLINQLKRALRKMEYPYEVKKRGAACHL